MALGTDEDTRGEHLVDDAKNRELSRQYEAGEELNDGKPLSPEEQTRLSEIESGLSRDDPNYVNQFRDDKDQNNEAAGSNSPLSPTSLTGANKSARKSKGFASRHKKSLLISSGALFGVIIPLAILLFLLNFLKLQQIEALYLDYNFARVDYSIGRRARELVREAKADAKGNSDTEFDDNATVGDEIKSLNANEADLADSSTTDMDNMLDTLQQASESDLGDAKLGEAEFDVDLTEPEIDDTGKTAAEMDKAVTEDDRASVQGPNPIQNGSLDAAAEDIEKDVTDNQVSPEAAIADNIGSIKILGLASNVSTLAMLSTFYCIGQEIYGGAANQYAKIRAAEEVRSAVKTNTWADAQKEGQASSGQIGAEVQAFDNRDESWTSSASYRYATHQPVDPTTNPALDPAAQPFPATSQLGQYLHILFDPSHHLPNDVITNVCKVVLQPVAQGAIAGIDGLLLIVGGVFSGGAEPVAEETLAQTITRTVTTIFDRKLVISLGKTAVTGGVTYEAFRYLGGMIAANEASATVTGTDAPTEKANVQNAGDDILANTTAYHMGGRLLTDAESALTYDDAYKTQQNQLSFVDKVFATSNPASVTSRAVALAPDSLPSAGREAGSVVAVMASPFAWLSHLSKLLPSVNADTGDDHDGIPQYGFTPAELSEYPNIQANATYVETHPAEFEQYQNCFKGNYTDEAMGPSAICNNAADNDLLRWRIYTLDRAVIHDYALAYNTTTDAAAADSPIQVSSDPAPASTLDTKTLATQILANKNITYAGKSSCGEAVEEPFQQVAAGQLAITDHYNSGDQCIGHGSTDVNPLTLGMLAYIGQSHSLVITAYTTGRHDTQGTENQHQETHASGAAVDIGAADGISLDPSDSGAGLNEALVLIKAGIDYAEANNDPTIDANIGSLPLPDSIITYAKSHNVALNTYTDSPNHLHIDMPWAVAQ